MAESSTRLLLRVSVKLLAACGLAVVLYALLSSVLHDAGKPKTVPPLQFQPNVMQENQALRLAWGGGNLILVKRTAGTVAALQRTTDRLQDPASEGARQPAGLSPQTRSLRPALFIAFDRGTDSGCPLQWIAPGNHKAPQQPWSGGFRDSCNGSWYDAAGRVYRAQHASRNLDVPPYRYLSEDLLEIGLNGDNAGPAK